MRESRSQIIAEHVMLALSRCALTERTYAQAVADLYMERTPLHARTVGFASSTDAYADSEANRQTVKRMLDGRVRMAVDLEEALVLALPHPFRHQLLTDLAARVGLIAAEQPAAHAAGQQHQVGDFIRDMGKALDGLSPMLDDGLLDERDAAYAPIALRELQALQARIETLCDGIRQHVLENGGSLGSKA